jgi:hypothetical protein
MSVFELHEIVCRKSWPTGLLNLVGTGELDEGARDLTSGSRPKARQTWPISFFRHRRNRP